MNSNWLTPSFFTSTSSRREVARGAAAMAAFAVLNRAGPAYAQSGQPVATKAIPHSGERIPVIGLGTANDFQKRVNGAERDNLKKVVDGLLEQGCKLIDTASSYGEAESVLGDLLSDQDRAKVFLATKIEDGSRKAGLAEFQRSLERLRYRQVDLLQLHNVQNAQQDLAPFRNWKG
ncbi:MAG: aldo/keto reductase, partial [Bradyrhizobium sp.]